MCGIGGIVRVTPPGEAFEPIPEAWVDALDAEIAWRGPDGAGRFRDSVQREDGSIVEVVLVHRRLSIIDHEGGAQPMVWRASPAPGGGGGTGAARDGGGPEPDHTVIALVFNGCIYNHREVRAKLEREGHAFDTDHSDTEVLLHVLHPLPARNDIDEDLAEALPGGAIGMWAAGCWSRHEGRMVLVRDRFGEKPLYAGGAVAARGLAHADGGGRDAFFASSVPAVLGLMGRPARIDRRVLVEWLALGSAAGPPYAGIGHVWAGQGLDVVPACRANTSLRSVLEWVWLAPLLALALALASAVLLVLVPLLLGRACARGLWGRTADTTHGPQRRARRVDQLHGLLSNSVAQRLDADVPIGCFLSGGIDSSLIAYYANLARPGITTLCVRMPDERYDESGPAQRVADILGTSHITVECADDPAGDLVHIIETLGLPFGDSSILPTYWLCKAARQHIKVALSGDGGDELFMGYERHRAAGLLGWGSLAARFYRPRLDEADPTSRDAKKARFLRAARGRGYVDLVSIFDSTDLRRLIRGGRRGSEALGRVYGRHAARRWDIAHYLPDDILRKTDTASLLCGLEVRAPFLDSKVADFALSLPPRVHLARGETKHLLRELARRHFPPEVTQRPKQGFAIPIGEWFRTDYGGMRTLLRDRLAGPEPFGIAHEALDFNMDYVRQMLDEHDAAGDARVGRGVGPVRARDHSQRLFMLLALAIWGQAESRRR